jgi:iron-sulfur cluster repair protein YtfE (RIC family)
MTTVETQSEQPKTDSLRTEHERLLDHVEHIRVAALELPALSGEERRELVDRIVGFLQGELASYTESEERGLYPYVNRLLGDPRATAPMVYDHKAIQQLTTRLRETSVHEVALLQELLYGLHALITVHVRKEEELYLPLLEREPVGQVNHVLGAMGEIRLEHAHPMRGDL